MKKLTALILTVLFMLSLLVACNTETPDENSVVPNESSEVTPNESSDIPSESSDIPDDNSQPDDNEQGEKPKEIHEYFGESGTTYNGKIYYITEQEHFINFAMLVETGIYDFDKDTVCLAIDIELDPSDAWEPIGSEEFPFRGTFVGGEKTSDGYDYKECERTISGLYYDNSITPAGFNYRYGALFDTIEGATIDHITVDNISSDGEFGIYGIAINSYYGSTIKYCKNNSDISSGSSCAGLVRYNYGLIVDCVNNGNITANGHAAGIAVYNYGTIQLSENNGTVSGVSNAAGIAANAYGMISVCTNNGAVNGTEYAGGIVGYVDIGSGLPDIGRGLLYITRCVNNGNITAKETAGGIAGGFWAEISDDLCTLNISDCLNTGKITATESGPLDTTGVYVPDIQGAGGIIGGLQVTVLVDGEFEIENCLNLGTIECEYQSGAVIGNKNTYKISIRSCYYLEDCIAESAIGTALSQDDLKDLRMTNWKFDEDLGHIVPSFAEWTD